VGYALGGAFDVAGRIAPRRREVEKVRVIAEHSLNDTQGFTGLVGVVRDGAHPRVKLYVARGAEGDPAALRRFAAGLARHLKLDPPRLPKRGTTDVVCVEFLIAGGLRLKAYQTVSDTDGLGLPASLLERLVDLQTHAPPEAGRCPLMLTLRGDTITAVQVRVDTLPTWAPQPPPGTRVTYVGIRTRNGDASTYFTLPGQPLDAGKVPEHLPAVSPPEMPKALDLSIGEHCNNNCTFCINPTESWAPLAETDRLLRVIEQTAAQGYRRLGFLGGEPTLHPELPRLVEHAYNEGYEEVMLVTNGRKLADPVLAQAVYDAGVRRALFMLLSHQDEIHDGITRKPGSLAQALAGARQAQSVGIEVSANLPVCRSNVDHLTETVAFLRERGIERFCFLYLSAYGNVLTNPGVLAPYPIAARELRRAVEVHADADLLIDNFPFCYLPGLEDRITGEMANPWREIAYPSGSIVDVSEVFRFRKIRLPECDGCRWDRVCGGVQDTETLDEVAKDLANGLRRARELRNGRASNR
jgi:MoaA/NifB/PqqE/SkfB family radical SAM enzyme